MHFTVYSVETMGSGPSKADSVQRIESSTIIAVSPPQNSRLPNELVAIVITFIPGFVDLLSCSLVCRAWTQMVFPIVHRCITLRARRVFETEDSGQNLVKQVKKFSVLMRSCVEELNLRVCVSTWFTLEMFVEVLDLFPNAKVVDYHASELPLTPDIEKSSRVWGRLRCPKRSLSHLCLDCSGVDFEAPEGLTHPTPHFPLWNTVSMFFHLLGLFKEIEVLDLVFLRMVDNSDTADPELAVHLPHLRTVITRHQEKGYGPYAASLLCHHLDPSSPVWIQDMTDKFNFVTHSPESYFTFRSVTRLSAILPNRDYPYISSHQFPALSSLELKASAMHCRRLRPPANRISDPTKMLIRSLLDAPTSLRDITFKVSIDDYNLNSPIARFSLDNCVIPYLKDFDWEGLRSLFKAKESVWRTRKVIFVMERETFMEHDPLKVPLSSEEIRQKLCEEIPALSACTSFEVMQK